MGTEELRSCFCHWREVRWSARLPHCGGHVRHGGGEQNRPQDDLLIRTRSTGCATSSSGQDLLSFFIPRSQVKAVVRWVLSRKAVHACGSTKASEAEIIQAKQ